MLHQVIERVLDEPDLPGRGGEIFPVREGDKVGRVLLLGGLLERLLVVSVDGRDEQDLLVSCVFWVTGDEDGEEKRKKKRQE